MRKDVKKIISFILSLVVVFGVFAAYSAEPVFAHVDAAIGGGGYIYCRGWVGLGYTKYTITTEQVTDAGKMILEDFGNLYYSKEGESELMRFNVTMPMSSGEYTVKLVCYNDAKTASEVAVQQKINVSKPKVVLNKQGGSGGTESFELEYGSTPASITVPTMTGYDFMGYYTGTDGRGNKYFNGDGTAIKRWTELGGNPAVTTYTLYAYWKAHTSETVIENFVVPTCENEGGYDVVEYCTNTLDHNTTKTYNPTYTYFSTYTAIADYARESVPVDYTTATSVTNNICHHEISRNHIVIPARGHNPAEAVEEFHVDPTCTEDGGYDMVVYCTNTDLVDSSIVCNAELSRVHTTLPALGHIEQGIPENVEKSTCTEDGTYDLVYYCIRPGFEEELIRYQMPIAATGHSSAAAVEENRVEATCTTDGGYDTVIYCGNEGCGEELSRIHTTLSAIGHSSAAAIEENRVEPKCTEDGGYDTVIYCEHEGCGEELSRIHTTLSAIGHASAAAIEENRIEPTCTAGGGYDTVVYCEHEGCGEELSRIHTELPALGHEGGEAVEENRVEPTCTDAGSYDSVIYCIHDGCGMEMSRETIQVPALGHAETELINVVLADFDNEGYSGDVRCLICGEIVEQGTSSPKIDENSQLNPEDVDRLLDEEIQLSEETIAQMGALTEDDSKLVVQMVSSANNTKDDLQAKLASGEMTQAEYEEALVKVETILTTAVQVGENKQASAKQAVSLQNTLPEKFNLSFAEKMEEFYNRQLAELLSSNNGLMDLTLTEEDFAKMEEAVEVYVDQMTEAMLTLRECSGEEIVAQVNQVISAISAKTFRDFDKAAADEEFAQDAYKAILINMQTQVKATITAEYEKTVGSRSCVGTAKKQVEQKYEDEMAAVEDLETFEIMVTEVMRQKYVSLLGERLSKKQITQAKYDEAMVSAADVDDFMPVYKDIFRFWALGLENNYGVTLEELTKATIDSAKASIKPDTYKKNESGSFSLFGSKEKTARAEEMNKVKSAFAGLLKTKTAFNGFKLFKTLFGKSKEIAAIDASAQTVLGTFNRRRFW